MNWDFLITGGVMIGLVLMVWARISNQTIAEVISDIKDMIFGGVEEGVEEIRDEVIMYE